MKPKSLPIRRTGNIARKKKAPGSKVALLKAGNDMRIILIVVVVLVFLRNILF